MNHQPTPAAPADPLAAWQFWQVPVFGAWMAVSQTMLKRSSEVMTDLAAFTVQRLHEDVALQQQLAACRDPGEVQQAWSAFTQRALDQYGREFTRLGEAVGRAGQDLSSAMQVGFAKQW
jgi:hypothetical protein